MKFLTPLLAVACVGLIISNVLVYQRFNRHKPIVTVGSDPISIYQYNAAVETAPVQPGAPPEATIGKATLRKIVFADLVRQAAAKAGVMPTDKDVTDRIQELQTRSPQLAQQASNPAVREDLKTDIALENLRIQSVTASDDEINAFYNNNKAAFTLPSQVQTTMVVSQRKEDADKAEHLLSQPVLASKPGKPTADDEARWVQSIAVQPGLRVAGVGGFNVNMDALIPQDKQMVGQTVLKMKSSEIKSIMVHPISGGQVYLTFKAKGGHGNELQPLGQVKEQVARQVKLRKAVSPQQELASLYQNNTPVFNVAKYSNFFGDIQQFSAQNTKKTASSK